MAKRRVDAKASNPDYSLSLFHRAFGFTKYVRPFGPESALTNTISTSFLLTAFDGRVHDLEKILLEEHLPEGWEPACKEHKGLTLLVLAITALKVELGAVLGPSN